MDDTYHYFQMSLAASPSSSGNFASIYGIYLDDTPGGPLGTSIDYVPASFDGIDIILDGHFSDQAGVGDTSLQLDDAHLHIWNSGTSDYDVTDLTASEYFFNFDVGGADTGSLNWRVAKSFFDDDAFRICGATHTNVGITFDETDCKLTPEPASMALMSLGLVGLAALRKRRKAA